MLWAHTNQLKSNLLLAYFVSPLIRALTNSIIKYDSLHTDCVEVIELLPHFDD